VGDGLSRVVQEIHPEDHKRIAYNSVSNPDQNTAHPREIDTRRQIMNIWQAYINENEGRFVDELLELIRIPSISALPEHAEDMHTAAEWVAGRLQAAGVENAAVMPTGGHPAVYGDWLHAGGDKPTILLYGHYDVQPVDPLELWESPPFEPAIRDDRIYARGASDDKGGMITPILAFETLLQTEGRLPVNVKFCFEGQEEIGSPQMDDFLAEVGRWLALECRSTDAAAGAERAVRAGDPCQRARQRFTLWLAWRRSAQSH